MTRPSSCLASPVRWGHQSWPPPQICVREAARPPCGAGPDRCRPCTADTQLAVRRSPWDGPWGVRLAVACLHRVQAVMGAGGVEEPRPVPDLRYFSAPSDGSLDDLQQELRQSVAAPGRGGLPSWWTASRWPRRDASPRGRRWPVPAWTTSSRPNWSICRRPRPTGPRGRRRAFRPICTWERSTPGPSSGGSAPASARTGCAARLRGESFTPTSSGTSRLRSTSPYRRRGHLRWDVDDRARQRFRAWAAGGTGYPLVDAGMRQLLSEGWVHNRVRMVAASFLVKDLHIDWRLGARWFLWHLVDGDLASNQHGWQWVAGTGTDAAPFTASSTPDTTGEVRPRRQLRAQVPGPGAGAGPATDRGPRPGAARSA